MASQADISASQSTRHNIETTGNTLKIEHILLLVYITWQTSNVQKDTEELLGFRYSCNQKEGLNVV
jgi:hypothetical protein